MSTTTKLGELIDRIFRRDPPEAEHDYILVEDGETLRQKRITDSEADDHNALFRLMGMDRRWMRRGL